MQNEDIAFALQDIWGTIVVTPTACAKHRVLEYTEPVVHEICHAVSLGFPLTKKTPDRTSKYFDRLNERSRILGLTAEVHAFAIEQRVLSHFGWLRHIRYTELMRDVYRTGYSGPCLPYRSFLALYRKMLHEESTYDLATKAIIYIERATRITAKQKGSDHAYQSYLR